MHEGRFVAGRPDHGMRDGVRGADTAGRGASKSQFFHYFPDGKDELLPAVARFEADRVLEDQQPHLGRLDSWESWRRWRDVVGGTL